MKRIVIVGGGVGGLVLATRLGKKLAKKGKASITLIDKNGHHFWKPVLHEVAAGTKSAYVNGVDLRSQSKLNHFKFRQGSILSIDREKKNITVSAINNAKGETIFPESEHTYDVLVMAVGSIANDFGTPGVKENCIFLNDYIEAESCRQKFLETLYKFSSEKEQEDTLQQVHISIVGAGATGVELAAELYKMIDKLSAYGVAKMKPEHLSIKILEASHRILPAVSEELAHSIQGKLEELGIQVLTNSMVTKADEKGFYTKDGNLIEADIKVWTAGIKAHKAFNGMGGLESSRANQFMVKETLQTTLDDSVFAIGDCAACIDEAGKVIAPATAQAASQMSSVCAQNIMAYLSNKPLKKFKYTDQGTIISIAYTAQGIVSTLAGTKPIFVKGTPAYTMHHLFYHKHQAELYGYIKSLRLALSARLLRQVKSHLDLEVRPKE